VESAGLFARLANGQHGHCENSREMAQMVVRYLVLNHEIPVYRIYTVGMGNAPIQAEGRPKIHRQKGGKVEISPAEERNWLT